MSIWQDPARPGFAAELDPDIGTLHSAEYRNPAQLRDGDVLVVGAANSGAEIALDLASTHRVWLSGRHPGQVLFRPDGLLARLGLVRLVLRFVFHRVLTNRTPPGRKLREYLKRHGWILVRTKLADLEAAGVQRIGRVTGIRDGRPQLEDGRVLDVAGVVWATGYRPGWSWIDLPVFDDDGYPVHRRGIATAEPGLAFVGFPFVRAASGAMIHGLWTDARHIAEHIATRDAGGRRAAPAGSAAARVAD
ncbi:MAG: hypothetical protein L0K86_28930 [Actinomycetia bacterium]|nr:hypothetical protein [Actinomycetes bacterium]